MRKIYLFFILLLFQIQLHVSATEPFSFAFFTDLHISASNPLPSEDLQNAVNEVNEQKGIDFVLISGDITQSADSVSYVIAKSLLDKLKVPYHITTGNHDLNFAMGGLSNYNRVFGNERFSFIHKDYLFLGFHTGPATKGAVGHVDNQSFSWLSSELNKSSEKNPVFVITHYPLQGGDVDNWKDLIDLFHKYRVKAVLGGHYHRNVVFNYDGIPGIINRSTLRGKESVGGYSIFSISDSLKVYEKRIGQPEQLWMALPLNE
jgi:3',5'-cyclic AMP phosphodiesterase CpdA